jgi:hypothetical protein
MNVYGLESASRTIHITFRLFQDCSGGGTARPAPTTFIRYLLVLLQYFFYLDSSVRLFGYVTESDDRLPTSESVGRNQRADWGGNPAAKPAIPARSGKSVRRQLLGE